MGDKDKEEQSEKSEQNNDASKAEEGEEEEECGFCIFMKGGGCKEPFTKWSDCVDAHREGEGNFTEECKDQTVALQECMVEHKDYYKEFLGLGEGEKGDDSKSGGSKESDGDKSDKKDDKSGSKDSKEKKDDKPEEKPEKQDGSKPQEKKESGKDDDSAGQDESSEEKKKDKDEKPESTDSNSNKDKGKESEDKAEGSGDASSAKETAKSDKSGSLPKPGDEKAGSKDLSNTKAEKHHEASKDSENKQDRVVDQESHPVKAKPDEGKKQEAKEEPPKPEKEDNKQDDSSQDDSEESENGQEEEEEEEEEKPEIKVETAPYDRRFVTTNQARHCYTRYQEYHRCVAEKGEDNQDCSFFQRAYRALCPGDWVDKWNEEREEGKFVGRY